MARVSTKENKNIYQTTREGLKLTREAASDLLETIAPERIEKIENEWCERMLATGAIDPQAYQAYRDAMRAERG